MFPLKIIVLFFAFISSAFTQEAGGFPEDTVTTEVSTTVATTPPAVSLEPSMVEIYGYLTTEVPSTRGTLLSPLKACTENCWNTPTCVFSYRDSDGYCLHYDYGNLSLTVTQGRNADGFVVAFKIFETQCPVTFDFSNLEYTDLRNDINFPFQWTISTDAISIESKCADPAKIFKRTGTLTVCMIRKATVGRTREAAYSEASTLCNGEPVFGVVSQAEVDFIATGSGGDTWVDGITTCDGCDYTFSNPLTTSLGDLAPANNGAENAFCLMVSSGGVLWAANCDSTKSPTGIVCGFQLK